MKRLVLILLVAMTATSVWAQQVDLSQVQTEFAQRQEVNVDLPPPVTFIGQEAPLPQVEPAIDEIDRLIVPEDDLDTRLPPPPPPELLTRRQSTVCENGVCAAPAAPQTRLLFRPFRNTVVVEQRVTTQTSRSGPVRGFFGRKPVRSFLRGICGR